jgi:hypothetical protein
LHFKIHKFPSWTLFTKLSLNFEIHKFPFLDTVHQIELDIQLVHSGRLYNFSQAPNGHAGVGLSTLALFQPDKMPYPALDLSTQLMGWGAPKGLLHLDHSWLIFHQKCPFLAKIGSTQRGYRPFPMHPTDIVGVRLSMLAFCELEWIPLPPLELSAQLMGWWAPQGLWALRPIWVNLGRCFDPKLVHFGRL